METSKQKRKQLDWIIVIFALAINILWYFVPLAGETAFHALKEGATLWVAIPISIILTGFFIGRLIMSIKRW